MDEYVLIKERLFLSPALLCRGKIEESLETAQLM